MLIVRAAQAGDAAGLYDLSKKTGTGLTTLPPHIPTLEEKIAASEAAFSEPLGTEGSRAYLLVLEDLETGRLAGTSAIIAGVGLDRPFYTYRMLHVTQVSNEPKKRMDTQLLQLSNDFTGACEVATLFLDPDYRRPGVGKMLSKARYLLMAAHADRFDERVISEIRGWVDGEDRSPFWEAIGRQFFDMDFKTADEINGRGNTQFITDLMPKFPIYTALLPAAAQEVIGKPHESAQPAIKLLEQEGFHFTGAVDIFDGGPAYEAHRQSIWTIRKSQTHALAGTVEGAGHSSLHLAGNPAIDTFRVTLTNVVETDTGAWLPEAAASALQLETGQNLIWAPLSRPRADGTTPEEKA